MKRKRRISLSWKSMKKFPSQNPPSKEIRSSRNHSQKEPVARDLTHLKYFVQGIIVHCLSWSVHGRVPLATQKSRIVNLSRPKDSWRLDSFVFVEFVPDELVSSCSVRAAIRKVANRSSSEPLYCSFCCRLPHVALATDAASRRRQARK